MCIAPQSRLFFRVDRKELINSILADVSKTRVTPAQHMNYYGDNEYNDSGYLSLFEYDSNAKNLIYTSSGMYASTTSAYKAAINLLGDFIHFFFIPNAVQQINIDESTVTQIPKTGRDPALLNTDRCTPPAKKGEDGETLEYANRYINEYLYLGAWAKGINVITERKSNSSILNLISKATKLDSIIEHCGKLYPCPKEDDYPPPGGGSFGGGDPIMA